MKNNRKELDLTLDDVQFIKDALADYAEEHPIYRDWGKRLLDRFLSLWLYWSERVPEEELSSFALRLKRL